MAGPMETLIVELVYFEVAEPWTERCGPGPLDDKVTRFASRDAAIAAASEWLRAIEPRPHTTEKPREFLPEGDELRYSSDSEARIDLRTVGEPTLYTDEDSVRLMWSMEYRITRNRQEMEHVIVEGQRFERQKHWTEVLRDWTPAPDVRHHPWDRPPTSPRRHIETLYVARKVLRCVGMPAAGAEGR